MKMSAGERDGLDRAAQAQRTAGTTALGKLRLARRREAEAASWRRCVGGVRRTRSAAAELHAPGQLVLDQPLDSVGAFGKCGEVAGAVVPTDD